MDAVIRYFDSLELDFWYLTKIGLVLLLGTFLVSLLGRFIFGKRSALTHAVSSAIGILFVYAVTVVVKITGVQLDQFLSPLPYVTITGEELVFFSFLTAELPVICSEVLSMVILAFLVNLADGWLPRGKNIFSWIFFRCLTVVIAIMLHLVVLGLIYAILPEGIMAYAPMVLLGILVLLLLTGALKIIVGALLSTVNPVIGALYTFFFATFLGKQITKAVLTTALLSGLVVALNYMGCAAISIASAALIAYIPFAVLLVVLWYIVGKLF